MFAYLTSKVLCNIYQGLQVHGEKKAASPELPHRLDRDRGLFGKHFQSTRQENYLLCAYPMLTSKISLVISLHDWFT